MISNSSEKNQKNQKNQEIITKKSARIGMKKLLGQGFGGTIGGPIFVILGFVILRAKGGLLISLFLNGILMVLFIMIYCELALSLPIAGGGYGFSREAIGGVQGFLIGWLIWIGNLLFASLSALGFGYSLELYIPNRIIPPQFIKIIATIITIVILIYYLKYPNSLFRLMRIFAFLLVIGFVIYITIGLILGKNLNPEFSSDILKEPVNFSDILSMTGFTFVIYCVYEWNSSFSSLTAAYKKIEKPRKNIPRTFLISIILAIILYWAVALTTLLNIGSSTSNTWNIITKSKVPLSDAFGIILNNSFGIYFMGIFGIIATLTSLQAGMSMSTQVLQSMSADGFIHSSIKKKKKNVAHIALIISTSLILVINITLDINLITEITNFIFLISMIFLSLSLIILRKTRPNLIRPWKVPGYPFTPIIAIISSMILLFYIAMDPIGIWSVIIGIIIVIIGGIYYLFQIARRDRLILLFYGTKVGISLLLMGFISMMKLDFLIGEGETKEIFLKSLIYVITSIAIGTLIFDLIPMRQWLSKFRKNENNTLTIAGVTHLSGKFAKIAYIFNYLLGAFQILLGLLILIYIPLVGFDVIVINSKIIGFDNFLLKQILISIFAITGVVYTINGIFMIIQEIEIKKNV